MAVPGHTDPGLQPERTTLAWTRTTLSLLVVAVLMARMLTLYAMPMAPALAVIGVVIIGVMLDQTRRHRRAVLGIVQSRLPLATVSVLSLGWGCAILALIVLISMVG